MSTEMPIAVIVETLRNRTGRSFTDVAEHIGQKLKNIHYSIDMFNNKFRRPTEGTRYELDEVLALIDSFYKGFPDEKRIRATEALQIFSETRMKREHYSQIESLFPLDEYRRAWQSILPEGVFTKVDDEQRLFKPLYPQYFIGRDNDVINIKNRLGVNVDNSRKMLTVIRGWPGVGKTTFVNKLLHDQEIEKSFPDGVLWASVGRRGNIIEILRKWARQLGAIYIEELNKLDEVVDQLRHVLQSRNVLMVVDDIWETQDGMWFHQIAIDNISLVLTTRFTEIALEIATTEENVYVLDVLSEDASMELFKVIAPTAANRYEPQMRNLARTLEGLPLALRVAGSLIEREAAFQLDTETLINELTESYELIKHRAPAERFDEETGRTPTIELLFQRSVETLSEDGQYGFTYLGAFAPKPATFDLTAIAAIWEEDDPIPLVRSLILRGLLEPVGEGRFQMHYTLSMYANLLLDRLNGPNQKLF